MNPRTTLDAFDGFLAAQGLSWDATILGGAALFLLEVVDRPTHDVDVLRPTIPDAISEAALAFARECRSHGNPLRDNWLNADAMPVGALLPEGWESRCQAVFSGQALRLESIGRADLLRTKLFAACDRGTDISDCVALRPGPEALAEAASWVALQDAHPGWPNHVAATVSDLARRLGHGL